MKQPITKSTKKPKVLFIGPYPPPYAGPEMGMKLFLESSLSQVFQIDFLNTNVRTTNVNKGRLDQHMVIAFFRFIARLTSMIVRYRPVLAYYPITTTQVGWVGRDLWCLFICRFLGIKTVIHLRGGHLKLNLQKFSPIVQKLAHLACHQVSLALVQAECLRGQFEGLIPQDRVDVLYNAIDTNEYDTNDLNKYDPKQILFMGHMTKAKGYCDLVGAIPIVAEKFPNVRFCFAGTLRKGETGVFFDQTTGDPLRYEDPNMMHEAITSGQYKDNYVDVGLVSGHEKMHLLRRTNIFVLPSYSEGFSRALLEAMSMGKPVICTPVGAHREVIVDGVNGYIVRTGDIEQLADRIIKLLSNTSLRGKMGETNYRYVRENFDITIIARQMEKYLKRVINERC